MTIPVVHALPGPARNATTLAFTSTYRYHLTMIDVLMRVSVAPAWGDGVDGDVSRTRHTLTDHWV
jgi:hypothetical protein